MNRIFTDNIPTDLPDTLTPEAPVTAYDGYIVPRDHADAVRLGKQCAEEINRNRIADFERTPAYCKTHNEENLDQMVHVSTFKIICGVVYMTYYANTGNDREDPNFQEARLAYCPLDNPSQMTILSVHKVGEQLCGKTIDRLYDTILLYKGGDEVYLLWTASADGEYYRFYRTFSLSKHTLSEIRPNRFKVGGVTNDFSMSGITLALAANRIPHKQMYSDIGIMQKLSTRVENGETYYYTGAYSGLFNCIIKSRDFVTWEYVASPDFPNLSLWENATYVLGDTCYYFMRQYECMQGILTAYDLKSGTWRTPCLVRDAGSRADFFVCGGRLYLTHAPIDRSGFGILRVNVDDLKSSEVVLVAEVPSEGAKESLFYPYTELYDGSVYISYTVDRKHIRLSKFEAEKYGL